MSGPSSGIFFTWMLNGSPDKLVETWAAALSSLLNPPRGRQRTRKQSHHHSPRLHVSSPASSIGMFFSLKCSPRLLAIFALTYQSNQFQLTGRYRFPSTATCNIVLVYVSIDFSRECFFPLLFFPNIFRHVLRISFLKHFLLYSFYVFSNMITRSTCIFFFIFRISF